MRVLSIVEVPALPRMPIALFNANGRFDEGYETIVPRALGENGIEMGFIDNDGHLYALYEYPYLGDKHVVR